MRLHDHLGQLLDLLGQSLELLVHVTKRPNATLYLCKRYSGIVFSVTATNGRPYDRGVSKNGRK